MSHEDATHGPAPLGSVDPEPLHRAVDDLAASLHDFVRTAVGVRSEFGAAEADEDPRVHVLEEKVGQRNADLFDALHRALGMHPDLTSSIWEPSEGGSPRAERNEAEQRAETFYLSFLLTARGPDASLDHALGQVDSAGEEVAERLADAGYEVLEWVSSRGVPAGFDDASALDDLMDADDGPAYGESTGDDGVAGRAGGSGYDGAGGGGAGRDDTAGDDSKEDDR